MGRKIRIGIDVGGTFTDAIAMDNETYDIVGIKKIHSTHNAPEGVTKGVVIVLHELLREIGADAGDVVFIAHGTTQATNALLEGDVANIGIIALGRGVTAFKTKADTRLGQIDLGNGKYITTSHCFVRTASFDEKQVLAALEEFKGKGFQGVVAAEAFSVDNPRNEQVVCGQAASAGFAATATHEISKLYGLKARTKTAVINASILPKMSETAEMTSRAVTDAKITAPLMIMRSDGGVMQIDDVRRRPILTVLSGPAAGVAGALMYEKISDGIFFEVGGTSTDISAIQNGKVITKFARIGGHSTYVTSLDINTVGIAGGSMVQFGPGGAVTGVGPRSAHILGLGYACFAPSEDLEGELKLVFARMKGDPAPWATLENAAGKRYALTLTCTANYLGHMAENDYARADSKNCELIFAALEKNLGRPAGDIARDIMAGAVAKVIPAVTGFIQEYNFIKDYVVLAGGGGGASAVVPALAAAMKMRFKITKNNHVISTIGAALAMVRDSVERTIINPTSEDILNIRTEAEQAVIRMGAQAQTVQVSIEMDSTRNIVKAVAMGTTELSSHKQIGKVLNAEEQKQVLMERINDPYAEIEELFDTGVLNVFRVIQKKKSVLPFLSAKFSTLCVIDRQGVIKLSLKEGKFFPVKTGGGFADHVKEIIDDTSKYDEGGQNLPDIFLVNEGKIADIIGMDSSTQAISLLELETGGLPEKATVLLLIRPW